MRRSLAAALVIVALLPSAFLAWQARDLAHLGYFHDDSLYFVAAKSLAEGNGYRIASFPDAPFQTKYPPLYPLLLSAVWRMNPAFPANLPLAMLFAWLMVPLYVLAARVSFADFGIGGRGAWLLCAVVALNPFVSLIGMSLFSELPFAVLLIAALALTERARRGGAWLAAAAGAVAGLAYLTRSAGVILMATGPLVFLASRRVRHTLFYTAAMAPAVAGWMLWTHAHRAPGADPALLYYTDYFAFWLRDLRSLPVILWTNFDTFTTSIGGMLVFKLGETFAEKSVSRILAAAALVGAFRLARRQGLTAYSAFAAAYIALILSWNYMPDQRFLIAIFPLLLAGFVMESERVLSALRRAFRIPRMLERAVAGGVAAAVVALFVFAAWRNVAAYTTQLPRFVRVHRAMLERHKPAYDWMAAHIPERATILAHFDPVVYLYTGRRARRIVVEPAIFYHNRYPELLELYESLPDYARARGLSHVLLTDTDMTGELTDSDRNAAQRTFRTDPRMRELFESKYAAVYSVNLQAPPSTVAAR